MQLEDKAMVEEGQEQNGDDKDVIPKAEFDELQAKYGKLEKDLEDVRMEVLTPEYMKFLDVKDTPTDEAKPKDNSSDTTLADEDWEKLSKKEIYERAIKTVRDEIKGELTEKEKAQQRADEDRQKRAISSFASTHEDYQTFRPIMYGLSLDPKNADDSLEQLYQKAKAHVKNIHGEPTDEQKKKSQKSVNEKPGGSSGSVEKWAKMSNDDIAREALSEMEAAGITLDTE
jgi:hypothetical protein